MKMHLARLIDAALVLTPLATSAQYYGGGPRHHHHNRRDGLRHGDEGHGYGYVRRHHYHGYDSPVRFEGRYHHYHRRLD